MTSENILNANADLALTIQGPGSVDEGDQGPCCAPLWSPDIITELPAVWLSSPEGPPHGACA